MKIYYLSLLHGTESLVTSFGYFNLGNVFASRQEMDKATDFFSKVTDIWYKHLKAAFLNEKDQKEITMLDELGIV